MPKLNPNSIRIPEVHLLKGTSNFLYLVFTCGSLILPVKLSLGLGYDKSDDKTKNFKYC